MIILFSNFDGLKSALPNISNAISGTLSGSLLSLRKEKKCHCARYQYLPVVPIVVSYMSDFLFSLTSWAKWLFFSSWVSLSSRTVKAMCSIIASLHRRTERSRRDNFRVLTRIVLSIPAYSCLAFSSPCEVSKSYRHIAEKTNLLPRWPESSKFRNECLVYDVDSDSYRLPSFDDGHGSLGVFGFLNRSDNARSIMNACDNVFEQFCSEISDKILSDNPEQQAAMNRWILQSPPASHHISVAILQEHPSFLCDDEDLANWRPISDTTIRDLALSFANDHRVSLSKCPTLELDSILWTPDGALIAGFIDNSKEQSFEMLRQSSRNIAQDILGDLLTTRPKNLIHATVGRIVGLPPLASDYQYQALKDLASEYNNEILPKLVNQIRDDTISGGFFDLEELSLARNIVWMLKEYKEYASWSLTSSVWEKQ